VTNDSIHTYTWDGFSDATTIDGIGIVYDAFDRMVEQNRTSGNTEIIYSPTGFKMQIMNGSTPTLEFVPLPGGAAAVYTASNVYYRHADWLGSSRFATNTPARTVHYDGAYAPFGEPYAQSGIPDFSFTGMNSDTSSGLYDFLYREYSTQGRWPQPDPAGLGAVDLSNPQSWNRYTYVTNNPLGNVDPLGMDDCNPDQLFDAVAPRHGHTGPRAMDCPNDGGGIDTSVGNSSVGPGASDPPLDPIYGGPFTSVPGFQFTAYLYPPPAGNDGSDNSVGPFFLVGGVGYFGGGDTTGPLKPCTTKAIGSGLLHAGIDAIGLVPEGGLASRAVGNYAGYRGIVATQQGTKAIQAVKMGAGIGSTGVNSDDTSSTGVFSTALGAAGVAATLASAAPVVGQVISGISILVDVYGAGKEITKCN
jgi:RHS repeat-associated protein